MKRKRLELSGVELTVLNRVWDVEIPVTCSQILEYLKRKYGLNCDDTYT